MAIETAASKSELTDTSGQFATFFVGDLFFGVEVLRVQEVLRFQQMTRVPRAPEVIEGLINLRGQIVAAIDMRRRLRLPPRAGDQAPMNMVVRTEDGAVSLLVDEIGDVLDVDAATWERPPGQSQSRRARTHSRRLQAEGPAAAGPRRGADSGSRRREGCLSARSPSQRDAEIRRR